MLHEKTCPSCSANNEYYDKTTNVSADKHNAVIKDMSKFYKKVPAILPDLKLDKDTTRESQSLKSSR